MTTNDSRSDAELLRASGRDANAFGVFYDRHSKAIGAYFVRRTADPALAGDLTSETFAQAFASRRRYRNTGGPAVGWLYTIARRQMNEFLRQQRVSVKYRSRLGIDPTATSTDDFCRVDDLDELRRRLPALRAALDSLTPGTAEAVVLRIGEGWSYDRLAAHLGSTPAAARVRVSRALHQLESELDSGQQPDPTASPLPPTAPTQLTNPREHK